MLFSQCPRSCIKRKKLNNSVQSYHSEQKSNIIRSQRKTTRGSNNLPRKYRHLDGLCLACGGQLERSFLVADVEEIQENNASEVYIRTINKSCSYADRKRPFYILETVLMSEHPTEFGKISKRRGTLQ